MARLCTLASGSSGNCTYISQGNEHILIDAGISCRQTKERLECLGVGLRDISAVFITHEHIDHVKGLQRLLRLSGAALWASQQTLEYLTGAGFVDPGTPLHALEDRPAALGGMCVHSFRTPHDSVGSVGYRVETSDDHRIAVVTDLGHVTAEVECSTKGCDLVMIEANYDRQMLQNGSYPPYLKKRIAGQNGHLSNHDCADLVRRLALSGTTRFVLAHLSQENNLPALADQTVLLRLVEEGLVRGNDYLLHVAPRLEAGPLIAF